MAPRPENDDDDPCPSASADFDAAKRASNCNNFRRLLSVSPPCTAASMGVSEEMKLLLFQGESGENVVLQSEVISHRRRGCTRGG